jgi:hypothetical protein
VKVDMWLSIIRWIATGHIVCGTYARYVCNISNGLDKFSGMYTEQFLLQMIMCKADGYIERETEWNGSKGFVDGADDWHQCGNPDLLYELFMEKSRNVGDLSPPE